MEKSEALSIIAKEMEMQTELLTAIRDALEAIVDLFDAFVSK
jgi:hypothetical protein